MEKLKECCINSIKEHKLDICKICSEDLSEIIKLLDQIW